MSYFDRSTEVIPVPITISSKYVDEISQTYPELGIFVFREKGGVTFAFMDVTAETWYNLLRSEDGETTLLRHIDPAFLASDLSEPKTLESTLMAMLEVPFLLDLEPVELSGSDRYTLATEDDIEAENYFTGYLLVFSQLWQELLKSPKYGLFIPSLMTSAGFDQGGEFFAPLSSSDFLRLNASPPDFSEGWE